MRWEETPSKRYASNEFEGKCVLHALKTVRIAVHQGRSRISVLVQIHQSTFVHVCVKARKTEQLLEQISGTVSVSADSGQLWEKG